MKAYTTILGLLFMGACSGVTTTDPLPSWNEGGPKQAILNFVQEISDRTSPHYVPPAERIAVFDNDGTLWCEQPMYFQAFFVFDRIRALASGHPEWEEQEPFAAVLKGDLPAALAGGERDLLEMTMATHAGMTSEEFSTIVEDWILTAVHPQSGRPFTKMVYQPMLELLSYLRSHDIKTYIVSGGGVEFMRVFSEQVYGVPPEQVIGSSIAARYEVRDGMPVIVRLPELHFIDDKAGKPVAIHRHIGRRPIMAFGNSDGDFEMLEWTTSGSGPRFGLLVHHTDSVREWAYDRASHIGRLDRALEEARSRSWTVVDMKTDWFEIFPRPH
jgi:phosphoserine phosphatase